MSLEFIPAESRFGPIWYKWRQEPVSQDFNPIDDPNEDYAVERLNNQKGNFQHLEEGKVHRWFVLEENIPVGTVAIEQINKKMKSASFGYQIGGEFSRRGLGTKIVIQFVESVFKETDIDRLVATVHKDNIASHKILKKTGFTREGTLREYIVVQGKRVDFELYAILRSDR